MFTIPNVDRDKRMQIQKCFDTAKETLMNMICSSELSVIFKTLKPNINKAKSGDLPKKPITLTEESIYNLIPLAEREKIRKDNVDIYDNIKKTLYTAAESLAEGLNKFAEGHSPTQDPNNERSKSKKAFFELVQFANSLTHIQNTNKISETYIKSKQALENLNRVFRRSGLTDFRETLLEILYIVAYFIYPVLEGKSVIKKRLNQLSTTITINPFRRRKYPIENTYEFTIHLNYTVKNSYEYADTCRIIDSIIQLKNNNQNFNLDVKNFSGQNIPVMLTFQPNQSDDEIKKLCENFRNTVVKELKKLKSDEINKISDLFISEISIK